eukprot:TRINITY_DN4781_c0_g1_i4.p1 TRINITY_DN4781_c0_g1~~TRINITY_DN4781_c0_g1_i4.p1  ORF type:complete len:900 (+),score=221.29 TRINITY_DN4781_c0_g1_i4:216-2915(+)
MARGRREPGPRFWAAEAARRAAEGVQDSRPARASPETEASWEPYVHWDEGRQQLLVSMSGWRLYDVDMEQWCNWFALRLERIAGSGLRGRQGGADKERQASGDAQRWPPIFAKEVNFSDNRLTSAGIRRLLTTLADHHVVVTVLKLHHNELEEGTCVADFLLATQGALSELHLSHNRMDTTAAVDIMLAAAAARDEFGALRYPRSTGIHDRSSAAPLWMRIEQNFVDHLLLGERLEAASSRLRRSSKVMCNVAGKGCTPHSCGRLRHEPPAIHAKHLSNQRHIKDLRASSASFLLSSAAAGPSTLSGTDTPQSKDNSVGSDARRAPSQQGSSQSDWTEGADRESEDDDDSTCLAPVKEAEVLRWDETKGQWVRDTIDVSEPPPPLFPLLCNIKATASTAFPAAMESHSGRLGIAALEAGEPMGEKGNEMIGQDLRRLIGVGRKGATPASAAAGGPGGLAKSSASAAKAAFFEMPDERRPSSKGGDGGEERRSAQSLAEAASQGKLRVLTSSRNQQPAGPRLSDLGTDKAYPSEPLRRSVAKPPGAACALPLSTTASSTTGAHSKLNWTTTAAPGGASAMSQLNPRAEEFVPGPWSKPMAMGGAPFAVSIRRTAPTTVMSSLNPQAVEFVPQPLEVLLATSGRSQAGRSQKTSPSKPSSSRPSSPSAAPGTSLVVEVEAPKSLNLLAKAAETPETQEGEEAVEKQGDSQSEEVCVAPIAVKAVKELADKEDGLLPQEACGSSSTGSEPERLGSGGQREGDEAASVAGSASSTGSGGSGSSHLGGRCLDDHREEDLATPGKATEHACEEACNAGGIGQEDREDAPNCAVDCGDSCDGLEEQAKDLAASCKDVERRSDLAQNQAPATQQGEWPLCSAIGSMLMASAAAAIGTAMAVGRRQRR